MTSIEDELITIKDVENQIRFELSDNYNLVYQLIFAIREKAEAYTRRALKIHQYTLTLDTFPTGRGIIEIPNPPLRRIDSIKYYDADGVLQTLSPNLYRVVINVQDPVQSSYVVPIYGASWPQSLDDSAVVIITYTCGYGTITNADPALTTVMELPKALKQWMLINIANLYENSESVVVGNRLNVAEIPSIIDSLIANYKIARW